MPRFTSFWRSVSLVLAMGLLTGLFPAGGFSKLVAPTAHAALAGFEISGTIADSTGKGIEGATVTLRGTQTGTTLTDSAGRYKFENLAADGTYSVAPTRLSYFFDPQFQRFTNLSSNQVANFTGTRIHTIRGQVLDADGNPLPRLLINLSGSTTRADQTDGGGYFAFHFLPSGGSYTIKPANDDYIFAPAEQTFNNLNESQTANFTATNRFGSISGRITDVNGRGIFSVGLTLSGAQSNTTITNGNGDFIFSRLLKGSTYTLTPLLNGHAMHPLSFTVTVAGDHTVNFIATRKTLKPFTAGNLIFTASKYLSEYTPDGNLVQDVIVPFPIAGAGENIAYSVGDVVLDKNGEPEIYNGPDKESYLTGYGFTQGAWRHHTYANWNPWTSANTQEGIASFGDFIFVTDKLSGDFGQPVQTQGLIRINLNDYSAQRFAQELTFTHITAGKDGLIYGIVGGTTGSEIKAYNPLTLELVKTIQLKDAQNFFQNVHQIAVNRAGEIYATEFALDYYDSTGKLIKKVSVPGNLSDVEVADDGTVAAAAHGSVTIFDSSLNMLSRFNPRTGAGYLAFTNAVRQPATVINFDADDYRVNEDGTAVNVTVTRTGDTSGSSSVSFATADATARSNEDYAPISGVLNFSPGERSKTFMLPITDDALSEGEETVQLVLRDAAGATLGSASTSLVIIGASDQVFTISGQAMTQDTSPLDKVTVTLSGAEARTVEVDSLGRFSFTNLPAGGSYTVTVSRPSTIFSPPWRTFNNLSSSQRASFVGTFPLAEFQLSSAAFNVDESAKSLTLTVTRSGSASGETFVMYTTEDTSGANERSDFTATRGQLRFAHGEVSKTVTIFITDDTLAEGSESFNFRLFNPAGSHALGANSVAAVTIVDNDTASAPSPVSDAGFNSEFFVRQHYVDFLNREPDAPGLPFWVNGIESCGSDAQCRAVKKIDTSAAFFLSIEFKETGYLVYRLHKTAFGNLAGKPVPVTRTNFLSDTRQIAGTPTQVIVGQTGWEQQLEANKQAFVNEFVTRTQFTSLYPAAMTAAQYVEALNQNAGGVLSAAERDALVSGLESGTETRASVLRKVAEDSDLQRAELNRAFVLMQYFGYLQRDPDASPDAGFAGYNFWLDKLNQFSGDFRRAEMVKAFITSLEYKGRFGKP